MTEKKLAILHLSDLHIGTHSMADHACAGWYRHLVLDIVEQVRQRPLHELFLVISGDITFSGKAEEFDATAEFLKGLMHSIGLRHDRVLLVPGNHDVSWGTRDDSAWCDFVTLMSGPQEHDLGPKADAPLRSFFEEKISFLMLDSTDASHYPERELRRLNDQMEQVSRRQHSVIAVIHHLNRIRSRRMEDMEDPLNKLLRKWSVNVVLHGHEHSQSSQSAVETDAWVSLGAGPLSPERWRHEYGAPSYHILEFAEEQIAIWTRTFVEQTNRWIQGTGSPLGTQRLHRGITGSRPALLTSGVGVTSERSDADQRRGLVEELAALSVHGIDQLLTCLGPGALHFIPAREARSDFIVRLVEYFASQDSLDVLRDTLKELRLIEGRERSVMLICATVADDEYVEGLNENAKDLGFSVRRATIGREIEGVDAEEAHGVSWDDVDLLLLVLSGAALDVDATTDELPFVASIAFERGIRVVLAAAAKCVIPAQLQGLPVIDITRERTALRLQMADVVGRTLSGRYECKSENG